MNEKNELEQKESAIKALAIIGFTATVVFGVWLAVQVVQLTPVAFTSLASLAQDIYGTKEAPLTVVSGKSVVNTGEQFTLTWEPVKGTGSYNVTFACTDGVTTKVQNSEGAMVATACDQPFPLGNVTTAEVEVISATKRFIDVAYAVSFIKDGETEVASKDEERVTVVNASIPEQGLVAGIDTSNNEVPVPTPEVTEPTPQTSVPVPTTPKPTRPAPVITPKPTYTITYPVSNPKGFTDLAIAFIGIGELDGTRFTETSSLDNDEKGALRLSIKNLGTKTSATWTYEVKLPNGEVYRSDKQAALRPLEIATITLGFTPESDDNGTITVTGSVDTSNDQKKSNDTFSTRVVVTD